MCVYIHRKTSTPADRPLNKPPPLPVHLLTHSACCKFGLFLYLKYSITMATLQFLLFSIFSFPLLLSLVSGVHGASRHHHHHRHRHLFNLRPGKLFVFGDSYADTGNVQKSLASSWKEPYGITFPGKPTGRFSDGRVFTDYLARFIGVKSPIPYKWRKYAANRLKYGMNFAYGGTGVFDTFAPEPNMTMQIDLFQKLITDKIYTTTDLHSSAALVSLAGNDYSTYIAVNGSAQGFPDFISKVVKHLTVNLKRIHQLGMKKVAVNGLQPLGCLPRSAIAFSFQQCNETENQLVSLHNLLLKQAVSKLNSETMDSTFVFLDLYTAFLTVVQNEGDHPGSSRFQNPLKPCCVGTSAEYSCGDVDENGTKWYAVCDDPRSTFFWDTVHPTQAGWRSIYIALQANLQQLVTTK